MNRYKIICTPEQTKKALELGAPIVCKYVMGEDGIIKQHELVCPTAEEMIGWLIEKLKITTWHIDHYPYYNKYGYLLIGRDLARQTDTMYGGRYLFKTRQEATLASIDAALVYLTNKKK